MRTIIHAVLALCLLAALIAADLQAHEFKAGDLTIDHPWARETAASQANGAAYFVVKNPGTTADRLTGASAEIAKRAELHTHLMEDNVMKMRQVEFLEIPAEGEARVEPGGFHVMLLGLKSPLVEGERFPLTLEFEQAGTVEVDVAIEDITGPADAEHANH